MPTRDSAFVRQKPSLRRLRAKLIRGVDLVIADLDRDGDGQSRDGQPRDLRFIIHANGSVETTLLNKYPIVTDADIGGASD